MEDKVLFALLKLGSVAQYSGSTIQGPLSDSSHIVLTGWVSNGKFGHDPQARFPVILTIPFKKINYITY
jgi:hypothetical protein